MVEFINEEWIPLAVSLGVPCQTFYSLTPKMLLRYMPYYIERTKYEKRMLDESAWIGNRYTALAIATCFSKSAKYPEKPFDSYGLAPKQKNSPDDEPQDVVNFKAWAMAFNAKKEKESEVT